MSDLPHMNPVETAPKDNTLVRLYVDYKGEDCDGALEDAEKSWTIGFNNLDGNGDDTWHFAGWDWCHDEFTAGNGVVLGWLPFHPVEVNAPSVAVKALEWEDNANFSIARTPFGDYTVHWDGSWTGIIPETRSLLDDGIRKCVDVPSAKAACQVDLQSRYAALSAQVQEKTGLRMGDHLLAQLYEGGKNIRRASWPAGDRICTDSAYGAFGTEDEDKGTIWYYDASEDKHRPHYRLGFHDLGAGDWEILD